ncbi:MAG: LysR family transcriptional regulator [Oscillospiraceae bacterium]|nr:LysR family transcriptional regulator [Oscillospiraceae bacterium]
MDINQLKYFISVAQTLNFSESARRNGLTQPSISHHINELEKQLGCRLFIRDKRSVVLTDAGHAFLPHAMEILEIADKAAIQLASLQEGRGGTLKIAALTTCSAVLQRCLGEFCTRHPDIVVDIDFTSGRAQTLAMNESNYDIHFAVDEMVPPGETFRTIKTTAEQLCLAFPKDHPLANEPLDFSKLAGERFISVSPTDGPALHDQIMKVCAARGYTPRVVGQYDRAEAVLLSVGAGLGIGIIPGGLSRVFYAENVKLVPIEGEDALRSYVLAWSRPVKNPAVTMFIEIAEKLFKND